LATLRLVPASGNALEIANDQALVGRDPACDIVLNDGSVSRRHARLERRGASWAIVDQGSANGTFIDSHRVTDATLRDGQELRLGSVSFRVELPAASAETTRPAVPEETVLQATPLPAPPLPPKAAPSPPAQDTAPPPPPRFAGRPSGPTAASPVPQMVPDPGAPPPRKGKGPFFWMVTGCFGCLTMVVLSIALVAGGCFVWTRGPVEVVNAELRDLRQGKVDDAYGRLSSEYKATLSRSSFERAVADHPILAGSTEPSFWSWSVHIVNDRGRVNGKLTAASGQQEDAAFALVKESGEWKIAAIRLGDSDLNGSLTTEPPDVSP
jgi:FHA domain-containing protein